MRLVTFCGSAGARSSNQALLDVVGAALVERGWEVIPALGLPDIPMLDPAIADGTTPPAVASLRTQFESADAVAVAIPEYGGGAAGWAKNALDWMVGSGSLYGRTVAVLSAGTTGGPNALPQIARTLTWQGANVVATCGVAAPATKRDANGTIDDPSTLTALTSVADRLATAATDPEHIDRLVTETLDPLDIPRDDRTGRS